MTDSTPQRHLTRIAALYPKFWRRFEEFRDDRGCGISDWPSWCYCPLAGAYAVISGGGAAKVPLDKAHLIGQMGAVAAWRPSKGIYKFDPDLAAALVSTSLDRDLPPGVLERLPEWCVWIAPVAGLPGFFGYLEHDANCGRSELRLAIDDSGCALTQIIVHLDRGSLLEGVDAALLEGSANAAMALDQAVPPINSEISGGVAEIASSFVSLLLYLCSDEPDFGGRNPPKHPRYQRRALGANGETEWNVGERIGSALRADRSQNRGDAGGTHASPRAHVRRAHWHTYWTGHRGAQQARCRWLAPILVGAGETVPSIHNVDVKPN
jgi:hypothetical protein